MFEFSMVSYFIYFLSYSRFTIEKGSLCDKTVQLKRNLKLAEPPGLLFCVCGGWGV
jgi:hypothetical protein